MPKEWQRKKADAGFAAILWPKEFGGYGGTPIEQVIYAQEEHDYFVHSGYFEIGIGMLGPTMMAWGKDEDKIRFLPKMITGEEILGRYEGEDDNNINVSRASVVAANPEGGLGLVPWMMSSAPEKISINRTKKCFSSDKYRFNGVA